VGKAKKKKITAIDRLATGVPWCRAAVLASGGSRHGAMR
jgi:hypothetical protein